MRDAIFVYVVITWLCLLSLFLAQALVWIAELHARLRRLERVLIPSMRKS